MTTHVDFAGDVDGRVAAAEGELAPRVADLAIVESCVAVDCREGARDAVRERNYDGFAWGDGLCDERRDFVHPAALATPDDEDDSLAGVVHEVVCILTTGAQPRLSVVGVRVCARRANTDLRHCGFDVREPAGDSFAD